MIKLLNNILLSLKGGSDNNLIPKKEILKTKFPSISNQIIKNIYSDNIPIEESSEKILWNSIAPIEVSYKNSDQKPPLNKFPIIIIIILIILGILIYFFIVKPYTCKKNCEFVINYKFLKIPNVIPLTKCTKTCNTISSNQKALISCTRECGNPNKPAKVILPNCTEWCFTNTKIKNSLNKCKKNCGSKNNPVLISLPNCKKNCFTKN